MRLMKATICMGRNQAVWKRASGMVICKASKDDSMHQKAYFSISLLTCIGKVVEKVVPKLQSEEAERTGLLSNLQFGSRNEQSSIYTTPIMLARAGATWNNGRITGVVFMDSTAVFPSRPKDTLAN